MSEPNLDTVVRHHEALTRARLAYIKAGQEPPSTAELLAEITAGGPTPEPSAPHVHAGAGTQQHPAPKPDFNENVRHLARHGYHK